MVVAEVEARRNGTGVPMPIKTAEIDFAPLGYEGWHATVRINPRSSIYDDLRSLNEDDRWWIAFGKVVLEWNLGDEDGKPYPLPGQVDSEREMDAPVGVLTYLYQRYMEEVHAAATLPKGSVSNSTVTSSTSTEQPGGG